MSPDVPPTRGCPCGCLTVPEVADDPDCARFRVRLGQVDWRDGALFVSTADGPRMTSLRDAGRWAA